MSVAKEEGVGAEETVVVQGLDNGRALGAGGRVDRGGGGGEEVVDVDDVWTESSNCIADNGSRRT